MIDRDLKQTLHHLLDANPAVVLTGPRQVGKTTLAREIAEERDAVYLDLERPSHLAMVGGEDHAPFVDAAGRRVLADMEW